MARATDRGNTLRSDGREAEVIGAEARPKRAADARARKRAEANREKARLSAGLEVENQESSESVPADLRIDDDTVSEAASERTQRRKAGGTIFENTDKIPAATMDKAAVKMLLGMVEAIMSGRYGDEGKFTQSERNLIEPSLQKILDSLSPKTAQSIAILANPAMLGVGILMYATRLSTLTKKADSGPDGSAATPAPVGPPNVTYEQPRRGGVTPTVQPTNGTRRNAPSVPPDAVGIVSGDLAQAWS